MGRVPTAGQAKIFEGNPTNGTNLSDANSIQGAIKGTLDNPSSANTKNFQTLIGLTKLDMMVPKRTTLPNDAVSFRGFPRPTLSIVNQYGGFIGSDIINLITVTLNNKVGFNLSTTLEFINLNNYSASNPIFTINSGLVSFEYELLLPENANSSGQIRVQNNSEHYSATTTGINLFFQKQVTHPFTHQLERLIGLSSFPSCPIFDPNYSYITYYSNNSILQVNSQLRNTNTGGNVTDGIYVGGSFLGILSYYNVVNGTIIAVQECSGEEEEDPF